MISFEKIDARLEKIGKTRAWLAEESGRKLSSINTSLAPNADEKNRSALLQKALSEVIEREELRQNEAVETLRAQNLVIEASREQFRKWNTAALEAGRLIEDWAREGLDQMAAQKFIQSKKTGTDEK